MGGGLVRSACIMLVSSIVHGIMEDIMAVTSRWNEIRAIQKEYNLFYWILGGIILVGIGVLIGAAMFDSDNSDYQDYHMNLYTEMIGVVVSIGITVFVIDRVYERRETARLKGQAQREKVRETQELKERLVHQAGSRVNQIAVNAVEELRHNGWLQGDDGLLEKADLTEANLRGANLKKANLQGAWLTEANLQGAKLQWADLREAELIDAKFQGAQLQGADLRKAEMEEAKLDGAILPDGSEYTDETCLARFTSPAHGQYKMTRKSINTLYRGVLGVKKLRNL